jgi:hypothetical protein
MKAATPIWRGGADKVAHGFHRSDRRTACGLRILDERFAHTPASKCPKCLTVLGLTVKP